jgi:2,3-bisphosphoglycerate-independent phosphoglycerate mutase
VEIIYVADDASSAKMRDGVLADVAPTLLEMLRLKQPEQMTGKSLLV